MLHIDNCIMITTYPQYPLLGVLLRKLIHGMAFLIIAHVPPFIHSHITLSFKAETQNQLLHSIFKANIQ